MSAEVIPLRQSRARLGPARNSVARLSDHIISIRHSEGDYNMRAAG